MVLQISINIASALVCISAVSVFVGAVTLPREEASNKDIWSNENPSWPNQINFLEFDSVDSNVTLSRAKEHTVATTDYIVELAIVCDKEWGDIFQHSRETILKYWSTFFWDLNMRYQTLPSSNISFLITSVTVIPTIEKQPFIENVRGTNGKVPLNAVLGSFSTWLYNQTDTLPKFDAAMLVLATDYSYSDGIAYLRGACRNNVGTVVIPDRGGFNTGTAAHELGHNLGAPEDHDLEGCTAQGYIMSGMRGYTKYHFSQCSDLKIKEYVTSDHAACLRSIDEPNGAVVSPDFAFEPLSRQEQCELHRGPGAIYDFGDCQQARCWLGNGYIMFTPMENTECLNGNGRCVRLNCHQNTFTSISNTRSKQCLLQADRFSQAGGVKMISCPSMQTPMNQFTTERVNTGYWIRTRFSPGGVTGDEWKCLEASSSAGGEVKFGKCAGNGLVEWELERLEPHRYLLKEATTQRCARQYGESVIMAICDKQDQTMWWQVQLTE